MTESGGEAIRVVIQQLSLRRYRVAAFRELASRPGLRVKLVIGEIEGAWMGTASAEGFEAEHMRSYCVRPLGQNFRWHRAQWHYATPRRADVLILSWDVRYLTLIPALLRAKLNGLPTILWGHGYSKQERGWSRWLRDRVARLGTAILLYNETVAKTYIDDGWDPNRVFVALNSLDQQPIQQARESWLSRPDDLELFRREHDLEDGPVVLFVSRLLEKNRTELLLEAAARLREEFPTMRIVIIGDGPEKPRLGRLATELGVDDITRFPGSIFEEKKIAPWFLSANVFCYPANIGLSILHAFGYGVPVVTSDNLDAQNPEIEALRPGENGVLYADGDIEDLARVLGELFRNPGRQRELGSNALTAVAERFNIRSMVDGIEASLRWAVMRAAKRLG